MLTIPPAFADATVNREGDAGREWIAALPRLVERLCQRWNLTMDGPALHGYLGLVIPVRRAQTGEPCALKVSWRDDATAEEALALAAWDGHGAARLLASQPAVGAMLLERLDHQRSLNDVEIGAAVEIAGRVLRRLAIPAPSGFRALGAVAEGVRRTPPHAAAAMGAVWSPDARALDGAGVRVCCAGAIQREPAGQLRSALPRCAWWRAGAVARGGPEGGQWRCGVWAGATTVDPPGGHRGERRTGAPFLAPCRGGGVGPRSRTRLDTRSLCGLLAVGVERWPDRRPGPLRGHRLLASLHELA